MKHIKYSLLIFVCLAHFPVFAQNWLWADNISSTTTCQANGMKLDKNGDIIQTIFYQNDITISGKTFISKGSNDIILAKYSPEGDTLWIKDAGSIGLDIPRDLFITSDNGIILTGGFSGVCDFDGHQITNTFSSEDIFITKYASDGTVLWAKNVAWGPDQNRSSGVVVDAGGNIEIVGFFKDRIYFEHDTLVSTGVVNNFFAKYDKDGNFIRAIQYSGTNTNSRLNEISLGTENTLLISGFYYNSITVYAETFTSFGSGDLMIMKIDTAGNKIWIRTGGGTTDDRAHSAATDMYGNVYLTGYASNNPRFDSTNVNLRNSSPMTTYGGIDIFAAKYNKNGVLQWKVANGDAGTDIGQGISIYNNIVQFTGSFSGEVIFKEDTIQSNGTTDEDAGIFIYNMNGNPIKAVSVKGSGIAQDQGKAAIYDNLGNIFLNGFFFSDTLGFDDLELTKAAVGMKNSFFAKYQLPFSASFTNMGNPSCSGQSNGTLTITPYFGAAPYTYAWDHDAELNDSIAYNLPAGTYSVTVTDSRDSVATTSITLTQPSALSLGAVQTDVSCYPTDGISNNGSINLSVTGGSGSYTYNWEAISGSGVNATAEDQTTLTLGIYGVLVKDNNLCEASDTFTINQPDQIRFGESIVIDETIPPGENGEINLAVTGGNSAFSYQWSGPLGYNSTDEDLDSLQGGAYTILATDTKSCRSDTTFLVVNDTMLIALISDKTNVDCNGNSTGSATVSIINGTGPFTYVWNNNLGNVIDGSNPTIINIPADIYYVTVTDDATGKMANTSVQIFEPSQALSANIMIGSEILCYDDMDGVADLTVNGGTLPFTFSWSNGRTEEDILNIGAGTYFVTVTDDNGCFVIDQISLDEPDAMDLFITIDQPIMCPGDATGRLTALATGGAGTKTYIWDDPGNQSAATATSLLSGIYHVTATDINECTITGQVELIEPAIISLSESHTDVTCFGEEDGIINLTVAGGTPIFTYEWSNGQITQDISGLAVDTFYVTVTDAHNCTAETSAIVTQPEELVIVSVDLDGNDITVNVTGGTPPYAYTLDGSEQNATGIFTDVPGGTHSVSVTDANSCGPEVASGIIVPVGINEHESDLFKIYPNPSDGIFTVELISAGQNEYRVQIFSANGTCVFDRIINQAIANNSELKIDLSNQHTGMYLMKINGVSIQKKLIIQ